jgi:hypothetical protein
MYIYIYFSFLSNLEAEPEATKLLMEICVICTKV